ncbi:hypothetical protein M427DRAFT_208795 [Gonapodya prolifera JEL478]|uniref:Rho-GAP domain-containing protein n=1 Tax=Gonapodya prolifera (strain JEL478) TaxID=1344416 RepID=A0A139ANP1_GONPJ|nr:hypothetical protein M427DRAFT_208795 [Gonapodya prolifera JEL478]|eukprot:KXS18356.1 hypothetical protein M427DRAFT_208795 [Gonapodya prolifera JEL478]
MDPAVEELREENERLRKENARLSALLDAQTSLLAQVGALPGAPLAPADIGNPAHFVDSGARSVSPPPGAKTPPGLSLVTQLGSTTWSNADTVSPHPDSATPSDGATFVQSVRSDSYTVLHGSPTRSAGSGWSSQPGSPVGTPRNSPGRVWPVGAAVNGVKAVAALLHPRRSKEDHVGGTRMSPSRSSEHDIIARSDLRPVDDWRFGRTGDGLPMLMERPLLPSAGSIRLPGRNLNIPLHPRLTRSDSLLSHPNILQDTSSTPPRELPGTPRHSATPSPDITPPASRRFRRNSSVEALASPPRESRDSGVSSRHSSASSASAQSHSGVDTSRRLSFVKAADVVTLMRAGSPDGSLGGGTYGTFHNRGTTGPALLVSPPSPNTSPRASSPLPDLAGAQQHPKTLSSAATTAPRSQARERKSWFPRPASASGVHPTTSSGKAIPPPIPNRQNKSKRLSWVQPFSLSVSIPGIHRSERRTEDERAEQEPSTPTRRRNETRSLSESLSNFLTSWQTRDKSRESTELKEKKRMSVMTLVFASTVPSPTESTPTTRMFGHNHSMSTSSITPSTTGSSTCNVFGAPLDATLEFARRSVGNFVVPAIVSRCLEFLEAKGLDEEGIYRLSGSFQVVAWLREQFELSGDLDLISAIEEPSCPQYDVHAVATLFKQYLRDLPEPILTRALISEFRGVLGTYYNVARRARASPSDAG